MEVTTERSAKESVQPKSNKKLLIIVMVFVLIFCFTITLLGIAGYLIYSTSKSPAENDSNTNQQNNNQDNDQEELEPQQQDSSEEEEEVAITKLFKGNFVQATIPIDWTIVEHSNAEGMYDFFDTGSITFSGLTGLDIKDENNNIVFQLKGIEGIGGAGGCAEVARFLDTEASYIQMVQEERAMFEFEPTVVIDLSSEEYSEISSLDKNMRRVGSVLYVAMEENSSVFNTACGISAQFLTTGEASFNINDGEFEYSGNTYAFGISESITDSNTLEKLDQVLNSLQKVL